MYNIKDQFMWKYKLYDIMMNIFFILMMIIIMMIIIIIIQINEYEYLESKEVWLFK